MRCPKVQVNVKFMLALVLLCASVFYVWMAFEEMDVSQQYVRTLRIGSPKARREAASGLGDLGMQAGPRAVPALAEILTRDADVDVRVAAAGSLANMTNLSATAAEALGVALGDPDARVREAAATTLSIYLMIPGVEPLLAGAIADASPSVRASALGSLGMASHVDPKTETAVIAACRDANPSVRAAALGALVSFSRSHATDASYFANGTPARRFHVLLLAGLRDDSPLVRRIASHALRTRPEAGVIDPAALVSALIDALGDQDAMVRGSSAAALGAIVGPSSYGTLSPFIAETIRAIPHLYESLPDDAMRAESEKAIVAIGGAATSRMAVTRDGLRSQVAEALAASLAHDKPSVRASAVTTLIPLHAIAGGDADALAARVSDTLGDRDASARLAGVMLLANASRLLMYDAYTKSNVIGPIAQSLKIARGDWPLVGQVLRDGAARVAASFRNGNVAQAEMVRRAVPDLVKRLDDPDPRIKRLAYKTLWQAQFLEKSTKGTLRTLLRTRLRAHMRDLFSDDLFDQEVAAWALAWAPPEDVRDAIAALEKGRGRGSPKFRERVDEAMTRLKRGTEYISKMRAVPWTPEWPDWTREMP